MGWSYFLFLFISFSYLLIAQQKHLQPQHVKNPTNPNEIFAHQQKISLIINQTFQDHFTKPQIIKLQLQKIIRHNIFPKKKSGFISSIQPYCPNSTYQSTSACCSSNQLYNLYNVKYLGGKFVGYSKSFQQISLPPIVSIKFQSRSTLKTMVTLSQNPFNCSKYFDGTLHVIGKKTSHKIYHASKSSLLFCDHQKCPNHSVVADNYIPMVSHIIMDALLNPEYLHLPRVAHFTLQTNLMSETEHMLLLYDLFAGGIADAKKVDHDLSSC
jgi:hypothetical protein